MHHVIVGNGPAALNAIETIRRIAGRGPTITLVGDEPPYSRMALPYWLAGRVAETHTATGDAALFRALGVTTRFGVRVTAVDPGARTVQLADGASLAYDRLLIATGSSPRQPPFEGADLPGVGPLWSHADTARLLHAAEAIAATGRAPRVVVIGAGFIGAIVLNAMHQRKWALTLVERESRVLPRMLPAAAADHVRRWLERAGIAVHCRVDVHRICMADAGDAGRTGSGGGSAKLVELADGRALTADLVVLATGIRPNLDLVAGSGIATAVGILVDERCRTSAADVYAAGDVAQGPALYEPGPAIHPIQPTAVEHGRVAGANMAGSDVRYAGSLAMNVVDACGLQAASFGRWQEPDPAVAPNAAGGQDAGVETNAAGDPEADSEGAPGDDAPEHETGRQEATTIDESGGPVYRQLLWTGDRITGAVFVGRAQDLGLTADVGMVKGLMQMQTPLGAWKDHLRAQPFDIRRAYLGSGVAARLAETTLLGAPTVPRRLADRRAVAFDRS